MEFFVNLNKLFSKNFKLWFRFLKKEVISWHSFTNYSTMRKLIPSLALIIAPFVNLNAQTPNFNSQTNWSLNKKELRFGIGATQLMGDLGGAWGVGRPNSLHDWDWQAIRYGANIGYRYRFLPMFATTTSLNFHQLRGDDKWSEEIIRNKRNLHVRNNAIELSQRFDVIVFWKDKFGSIFNLPGNYSKKQMSIQVYGFAGLGIMYHNPQAMDQDGNWTSLRPLKTEGQEKPYSPVTLTMPMGVGFRWGVGRMWRVGFEASYVKTFSDYLDDVSTTYTDPSNLASPTAVYLANPAFPHPSFAPGQQRGNPGHKDAFYHFNVIITKNLTFKDYGRQRSRKVVSAAGKYRV
jgi:hypothetical protein